MFEWPLNNVNTITCSRPEPENSYEVKNRCGKLLSLQLTPCFLFCIVCRSPVRLVNGPIVLKTMWMPENPFYFHWGFIVLYQLTAIHLVLYIFLFLELIFICCCFFCFFFFIKVKIYKYILFYSMHIQIYFMFCLTVSENVCY